MKKLLTSIICVLLVTTIVNAQDSTQRAKEKTKMQSTDPGKQNSNNKGNSKKNLEQLDLSKDQEKQIDGIRSNSRQEKGKINNDKTLTPEQKKEKIKAIDKESKNKINALLTPEQRQKMKQQKTNDKEKAKD